MTNSDTDLAKLYLNLVNERRQLYQKAKFLNEQICTIQSTIMKRMQATKADILLENKRFTFTKTQILKKMTKKSVTDNALRYIQTHQINLSKEQVMELTNFIWNNRDKKTKLSLKICDINKE